MEQKKDNFNNDDRLTDFTDRVLSGKSGQTDPNADDELRGLEETILRLNRAIPRAELDDATVKQWEARLANRLRKEQTRISFRQKWFGSNWKYGQLRPQAVIAVGALALAALAVLVTLKSPVSGASFTASAFARNQTIFIAAALVGLILVTGWINRRK